MVGRLNDNIASNPEEDDEALLGSRIDMSDIFKHISVVYVDALRDVLREMKNNRNPVKRIMETIDPFIPFENENKLPIIKVPALLFMTNDFEGIKNSIDSYFENRKD